MGETLYDHREAANSLGLSNRTFRTLIFMLYGLSKETRQMYPYYKELKSKYCGNPELEAFLSWAEKQGTRFDKLALTPKEFRQSLYQSGLQDASPEEEEESRQLYKESELIELAKHLYLPFVSKENTLLWPEIKNDFRNDLSHQQIISILGLYKDQVTSLLEDAPKFDAFLKRNIDTWPYITTPGKRFYCSLETVILHAIKYRVTVKPLDSEGRELLPFPIYPDFGDLYTRQEAKDAFQDIPFKSEELEKFDRHSASRRIGRVPGHYRGFYYMEDLLEDYLHSPTGPMNEDGELKVPPPPNVEYNTYQNHELGYMKYKKLSRNNPLMKHLIIGPLLKTQDEFIKKEQQEIIIFSTPAIARKLTDRQAREMEINRLNKEIKDLKLEAARLPDREEFIKSHFRSSEINPSALTWEYLNKSPEVDLKYLQEWIDWKKKYYDYKIRIFTAADQILKLYQEERATYNPEKTETKK